MSLIKKVLGAAVAVMVLVPGWAFAITPTTVKATRNTEFHGSGNAEYFAWTFSSLRTRHTFRIKVDPPAGAVYSLNTRGRWVSGSMDQTGSLLPYYKLSGAGKHLTSDVYLYDMAAKSRVLVPPGVNTSKAEFFPALSGNQLTFLRTGRTFSTLYLVTDLTTGDKIKVKSLNRRVVFANAPNLMGNWVTYAICKRSGCEAFRYDIGLATTIKVPNPLGLLYFAPSVDLAGNVYVERSGPYCGSRARMMRWDGSGDPSIVYKFPRGHDLTGTSVFDDGAGSVTLYVDALDCSDYDGDIVSFSNP